MSLWCLKYQGSSIVISKSPPVDHNCKYVLDKILFLFKTEWLENSSGTDIMTVALAQPLVIAELIYRLIGRPASEVCIISHAARRLFKDVRANCLCASLLRTQIHATSCMSARAK